MREGHDRPVTYDDDDRATRHLARTVPRVYRCLQQAAFTSKVCSTSARGAPSREESLRRHVDRQRGVYASVCAM